MMMEPEEVEPLELISFQWEGEGETKHSNKGGPRTESGRWKGWADKESGSERVRRTAGFQERASPTAEGLEEGQVGSQGAWKGRRS